MVGESAGGGVNRTVARETGGDGGVCCGLFGELGIG